MVAHGCPMLHAFAMVKHQPNSFKIPLWLHMPRNINAINMTMCKHLEQ